MQKTTHEELTKEAGKEIIFSYNNTRCHALKVESLLGGESYIGMVDGWEIYQIDPHALFDQFGFVAIEKKEQA